MPEDDEPRGTELHSKATGCRKLIGFDPVVGLYAAILPLESSTRCLAPRATLSQIRTLPDMWLVNEKREIIVPVKRRSLGTVVPHLGDSLG